MSVMAANMLLRPRTLLFLVVFCLNNAIRFLAAQDCEDPQPPGLLAATAHNATTFSLSWSGLSRTQLDCTAGFRVCLHRDLDNDYSCVFVSCAKLDYCAADNITWSSEGSKLQTYPCYDFSVSVAAVYGLLGEDGLISEARHVSFQAAPVGVTDLSAVNTTSHSTLLEWKASSSSCADHYDVSWCAQAYPYPWLGECRPTSRRLPPSQGSLGITGLAPCTNYLVAVSTVSGSSPSQTDATIHVTTRAAGVQAVQNLTVAVSGNAVRLYWDELDRACVKDHEVCWWGKDDSKTCRREEQGTLHRLDFCSDYNVSVRAFDVGDSSSATVTHHFTTGAASALTLKASHVAARSAALVWQPSPSAGQCGRGYELSWCVQPYTSQEPCEPVVSRALPLDTTRANVTGLYQCLRQRISLVTVSAGGWRSDPRVVVVRTGLDDLGPPRDLRVDVLNSAMVWVYFSPPDDSGNCVPDYRGCFWEDDDPEATRVCLPAPNTMYWFNGESSTKPCTNYTVEMTALSTNNKSASASVSFTSAADEVKGLKVENVTSNYSSSARLSWNADSFSKCVRYQHVTWSRTDGYGASQEANISADATQFLMEDLDPCTEYSAEVMRQAPSPSESRSLIFYSASNVTAASGLAVTCEPGKPAAVLSFFAPPSPRCVANYSVCWGPGQAPSPDWSCRDVGGTGHVSVSLAGLNRSEQYGCSVTPVAPDCRPYSTARLAFNYTCSGCVSKFAPSIGVLVLLPGVLRLLPSLAFA
ncbi:tenascin-R-like [Bacillus rossius redtenbacheri]|uniref:tenascin-R-like n=1 Tax=Bacillus rossius redtenbacheri TaxID=93214 RepID=UPI002FDE9FB9